MPRAWSSNRVTLESISCCGGSLGHPSYCGSLGRVGGFFAGSGLCFAAAPWAVLLVVCGVEAPWAIHCSAALGAVFAVAFQALGHCSVQHCEGSMTNCRLCSSYLEATAFFWHTRCLLVFQFSHWCLVDALMSWSSRWKLRGPLGVNKTTGPMAWK